MANPKADMDQRAVQLVQEFGGGCLTPVGAANNSDPDVPISQDYKIGSGAAARWWREYWTGTMWWSAEAGVQFTAEATQAYRFRPNPGH